MRVLLTFFALPEGEGEMNIQFFQMKLTSGRYKTKDADYSHNVQSTYEISCYPILWVLEVSVC